MEILKTTYDNKGNFYPGTFMRDICEAYLNKKVTIHIIASSTVLCGILNAYNDNILHLFCSDHTNEQNTYISRNHVFAISGEI